MPYKYVVSTQGGELERGRSSLPSREAVIQDLESRGLVVISVEEARVMEGVGRFAERFLGRVSHVEKVVFTKHLALMLKAGLTVLEALRILEEQAATWNTKKMFRKIADKVEGGGRFSEGLSLYPNVFSQFYINIVQAGEFSGNLEENLEHLATQFTKDHELRKRVKNAMLYPVIVVIAALFIGFFFATYVIPQIAKLFSGLKNVEMPLATVVMLRVAEFSRENTWQSFVGLFGGIGFLAWFLRRRFLQPFTHYLVLRLPIARKITMDLSLARFSLILGSMLQSGIDITQALSVTQSVLGNYYYKKALGEVSEGVQRGETISQGLMNHSWIFPSVSTKMLGVGERTGKFEEVLGYLAEFYELEVESFTKNLATILEPVLLLGIGLIALALAFAILMPIYNFISAIQNI